MSKKNTLSVVVSAYNEEENIDSCLTSVENLADEIIVIDHESSDKTLDFAKKYTKKIYSQKNNPQEIDLQKNFGFSKASGDWILSLDADEQISEELADEIKRTIDDTNNNVSGIWVPRKNIIFGKWIQSDMWWPDYQLKFFRRGKGKFEKNEVHHALTVNGETIKIESPILHNNYNSISQYIKKLNNYTDIEAENLVKDYNFNFLDAIRFPVDDFVKTFFLQKGFRDGLHGLVLSILQAFYMEVVFAKLWEKNKFIEVNEPTFLKNVKEELKNSGEKVKYWATSNLIDNAKNPFKKILLKTARKISSSKIKK